MSDEEKRALLKYYCGTTVCSECPLNGVKWDNPSLSEDCLSFSRASEIELDRALTLFRERYPRSEPDYWSNICEMQKKQTEKGVKTYGQTLEDNTGMTIIERLEYLEEELIDSLMYIEHIKSRVEEITTLLKEELKE